MIKKKKLNDGVAHSTDAKDKTVAEKSFGGFSLSQ
jgi:hypothetical protein